MSRLRVTTGMRTSSSRTWPPTARSRSASPLTPSCTHGPPIATPIASTSRRSCAVADFAITQFFFEVDHYLALVDDLAALGIDKPVLPGIMPVTNVAQVSRMAGMSGTAVPAWLVERVGKASDDVEESERIGIDIATELCAGLLDAGAPGLHFYTLNRSSATRDIYANLGLPIPA